MLTHFITRHCAVITAAMLLSLSTSYAQNGHGTIPIEMLNQSSTEHRTYGIDTLDSYPVGPGVVYTRFDITNGSSTRHCYVYEVDLTNPYIRVEETHAATLGQTELMTTTHQRLNAPGHRSIGSVNCNFWETKNTEGLIGVACQGQVSNGKIGASITPDWGIGLAAYYEALGLAAQYGISEEDKKQELGFLMIDTQGQAWINQYAWNSGIRIGEATYPLREANRNRNNPEDNEIVLFNSDLGSRATRNASDLYEVVMDLTDDCQWTINKELHGRVVSTNTTGGTLIGERQAVLQGRGTGRTFLEQAAVGDTIAFAIGIYDALTGQYPQIEQLSAGNGLVMRNGQLRFRNWAEDNYNHVNYPRTGFGVSADHNKLWMMVMEKPGMFTSEMCSILRHFGAADAMGADGGGSAQFNLMGKIINPTTEANPRAVSNAIFLFATSPDDNTPATLLFHDHTATLNLPSYASYTPDIRAYNQYGLLISNNFTDYTLSCQPASLGTVSADGKSFTASPTGGDGLLIVTAGEAQVTKTIHISAGELSLALDSIICDLDPYTIELFSTSEAGRLPVDPAMASWRSTDEQVATVENGVLRGVSNGSAIVYGTLGDKTDSLLVHTEIATREWMAQDVRLVDTVLNYSSTRGAAVEIPLNLTIYGRPTEVVIELASEPSIKSATVTTLCANTARHTTSVEVTADETSTDVTHRLSILPEIFSDQPGAGMYPFFIEKFKCMLTNITKNTDYSFRVLSVTCHYNSWNEIPDALPAVQDDHKPMKFIIGGQLYIMHNNQIFDINGKQIR